MNLINIFLVCCTYFVVSGVTFWNAYWCLGSWLAYYFWWNLKRFWFPGINQQPWPLPNAGFLRGWQVHMGRCTHRTHRRLATLRKGCKGGVQSARNIGSKKKKLNNNNNSSNNNNNNSSNNDTTATNRTNTILTTTRTSPNNTTITTTAIIYKQHHNNKKNNNRCKKASIHYQLSVQGPKV